MTSCSSCLVIWVFLLHRTQTLHCYFLNSRCSTKRVMVENDLASLDLIQQVVYFTRVPILSPIVVWTLHGIMG